jgi:hypothetical protein
MPPEQELDASEGASASDSPATAKRKVMSSNLLNMKVLPIHAMVTHRKFMQRGRDAEIAAKLQEQYKKEVSDQQWHLSTVREVDVVKLLLYRLKLTCLGSVLRKLWLHMNQVTVLSKSTSDLMGK